MSESPVLVPINPQLIQALQAVQTFFSNVGTDPTKFPLTFPGASAVLLGTLQVLVPSATIAETQALQNALNAKIAGAIASLQAQSAAAATAAKAA